MLLPSKQGNFAITQLEESILGSNLFLGDNMNHWSLWLLWKCCYHRNQKTVQLLSYWKDLKLAHMYFLIKHITGLPGCYGSAITMATRELCNKSLKRKYMFFVTIRMTDLSGSYGSTVTGDRIKSIIIDHT